ncbi:MAG: hypothetical protein Q9218_002812 [Villophora microphyllina]
MSSQSNLIIPVPKRKKRHSSLLDVFVSHEQVNKIRMDERVSTILIFDPVWLNARKRAAAEKAAETAAAIAAATAAVGPAPAPALAPAPAAPAPAAPAAAAPEAPKPEEAAKPAEDAAKAPWTPAEDFALVSLKGQDKSWKEIGDVLVGRDRDELRLRYKEIGPKEGTEAPANNEKPQANNEKGKNGKQKGEGGKKGKGNQQANAGEKKDEAAAPATGPAPAPAPNNTVPAAPAPPAAAPINPVVWPGPPSLPLVNHHEAIVVNEKDSRVQGILRRGMDGGFHVDSVTVPAGATNMHGSPIIYMDESDPLNMDDLSFLYNMKCIFEERKWVQMASKLFDQTGKRIEPEWIKAKLQHCA